MCCWSFRLCFIVFVCLTRALLPLSATASQCMSYCTAFAIATAASDRGIARTHDKVVDGAALSFDRRSCGWCSFVVPQGGGLCSLVSLLRQSGGLCSFVVALFISHCRRQGGGLCSLLLCVDIVIFLCGFTLGTDIREYRKASSELSLKVGSDSFHSPWLLRCRCVCPGSTSTQLTCEPILGLGLLSLPPPSQTCCPSTTETRRI